jgi:hypothetical protein
MNWALIAMSIQGESSISVLTLRLRYDFLTKAKRCPKFQIQNLKIQKKIKFEFEFKFEIKN